MKQESIPTEPVLWSSYPSWRQFSWLYLISALIAWRAVLFRRFDLPGWEAWLLGALALLVSAALLRRWARYELTAHRAVVRNGYTGGVIAHCPLSRADRVDLRQGPVASVLGLGSLVIKSGEEPIIRFRGISDPHEVKQRIERAIAQSRTDAPAAAGF